MRSLLFFLLLLVGTSALADWVKLAVVRGATYYVDPATIRDNETFRRMPVIEDYATQESAGVRSRRILYEVDCSAERLRSLSITEHSEPMAQGASVYSWEGETEWLYIAARTGSNIAPRTPYRQIFRIACSR